CFVRARELVAMNVRDRSNLSPIRLSAGEMIVVCATVLLVVVGGALFRASGSNWSNDAAWTVGGDFVQFYAAGRILNNHDENRLYDVEVQDRIYREVMPGAPGRKVPFGNSPR